MCQGGSLSSSEQPILSLSFFLPCLRSLSLTFSPSLSRLRSHFLSVSPSVSPSLCLSPSLSRPISLLLSVSPSLSCFLSVSLCLSPFFPPPHCLKSAAKAPDKSMRSSSGCFPTVSRRPDLCCSAVSIDEVVEVNVNAHDFTRQSGP